MRELQQAALHRHVEQQVAGGDDDAQVEQRDEHIGDDLADDHLDRPDRRGEDLLQGAALVLLDDAERGENGADDHHDHGDDAGHDEVDALQLRIVPDAALHLDRRARRRGDAVPLGVIGIDDRELHSPVRSSP